MTKSSIEISPSSWTLSSAPSYGDWIKKTFAYNGAASSSGLFAHQRFVRDFMQEAGPNRGILLYHGLGVGKTRSAVAIAQSSVGRDIHVLLPASLRINFEQEVAVVEKLVPKGQRKHYNYISYDGVKRSTVLPSFDDSLVIIDEVHTFVSRVVGNGVATKAVYQKLMDASNCKIVALSGTPIINNPFELGYALNLVHGYTYAHIFKPLKGSSLWDAMDDLRALKNVAHVETTEDGFIKIVYMPKGFVGVKGSEIVASTAALETPLDVFNRLGIKASLKSVVEKVSLFPITKEEFEDTYIDYPNLQMMEGRAFSLKATGLVSYFESYDAKDFPVQRPIEVVNVPMRKIQFGKYITVRQGEVDKEKKAKMSSRDDNKTREIKTGNIYRAFSRAMCNFVFPDEIPRPYPSTMAQFKGDVDEDGADEEISSKAAPANALYNRKIAAALKALEENAETYLSMSGLEEYGPKMKAIIERLDKNPGSALIYSSFRNVEGIKILSMAMEHVRGYVELKVKKDKQGVWRLQCSDFKAPLKYIVFTENREETRILMHLFNSAFELLPDSVFKQLKLFGVKTNLYGEMAKVLMITQSGAQGISLKNVRQVHITEPFWNEIRIRQVRGRAIRAFSHSGLPEADRTVDTFVYIMALTSKEQVEHILIKSHDDGKSSDGYIYDIAQRKMIINDQFLQAVKNVSVDCALNKKAHGVGVSCFKAAKPVYKTFDYKKLEGRRFSYEEGEDSSDGWITLYEGKGRNMKKVGRVMIGPSGKPSKIVLD